MILDEAGWYEGQAYSYPSTNNALEATNSAIKKFHTFRERASFSKFIKRLKVLKKLQRI